MDERNNDFSFDFTPLGQAIKKAPSAEFRFYPCPHKLLCGYTVYLIKPIAAKGNAPKIHTQLKVSVPKCGHFLVYLDFQNCTSFLTQKNRHLF